METEAEFSLCLYQYAVGRFAGYQRIEKNQRNDISPPNVNISFLFVMFTPQISRFPFLVVLFHAPFRLTTHVA